MNDASKRGKRRESAKDVLRNLEHLLEDVPDNEKSNSGDDYSDQRPTIWRGLDWVSKAQTLVEMERYKEAIEQCDEALSINPGDPKALFVKGEAYRGLGNLKRALDCYTNASRMRPNDEEMWYATGIVLKRMGRLDEALAAFEKATEISEAHHDAWYERAVVLRLLGRHEESRGCLEKAFRDYPVRDEGEEGPEPASDGEVSEHEAEEDERSLEDLESLLGDLTREPAERTELPEEIPFDIEDEKILLCTINQSLNIQQIRGLTKMPLVSCYKKVRRMEELGLLRRVRVEVDHGTGKRIGYYRTNLRKVKLYSSEGRLKLGIEFMQLIPRAGMKARS